MTPIRTPNPFVGHVCGCSGARTGTYIHIEHGLPAVTSVSFKTDSPPAPTLHVTHLEVS